MNKKSKKIMENEKLQKHEILPPDGGWGWLVLFGCTLINILVPGTIKSFGVLFVDFLEIYEFSEIAATWIPALSYFLYCSLGPLASYLSNKFSYRTVTLIGGFFASFGMMLSYFATSVICLCITYGFLFGIGAGLSFSPGILIVTSYFDKYRGLANGIAISGSAFGSIILPPLLRYLLENFGVNDTVLIMGALIMNVWVGALFYHPVKWHVKSVPVQTITEIKTKLPDSTMSECKSTNNINILHDISSKNNLNEETEDKINSYIYYNSHSKKVYVNMDDVTSYKNSIRKSASTKFTASCESTLGRTQPEFVSQMTLKSLSESLNAFSCWRTKQIKETNGKHKKASQFSDLISNPAFIIILISNASVSVGYTNFMIFLPAYAISSNYDKNLSSCLLSIVALFDLIGRIGGSTISDILSLEKKYYFIVGTVISGITLFVIPLANSYSALCAACAIFGLSSGTYIGVTVVTMHEMLGEEKLAMSYTISLFINGIVQLIGPPICGVIFKQSNSFDAVINGLGFINMMGTSVWLFLFRYRF